MMEAMPIFGLLIVILAALLLTWLGRTQRLFTLLGFTTIVVFFEYGAEAMKLFSPSRFPNDPFILDVIAKGPAFASRALASAGLAYAIFYVTYFVIAALLKPRRPLRELRHRATEHFFRTRWTLEFRIGLALITIVTVLAGYVQPYQRIRAAGGFAQFLMTAYRYRVGTSTETAGETAVVNAANLLGGTAVCFLIFWTIAWFRGRLSQREKIFVVLTWTLLLFRQLASMSRGTFFFTILALAAAILSERPIPFRRLVAVVAVLLVVLLAVNYVHMYLYFLTAGWERQDLVESTSALIGAHGHLFTLATILGTLEWKQPLQGRGLLASAFFFIPRAVWHDKPLYTEYGTHVIQDWAGLPMTYQMAVTAPGEQIAHFGYLGLVGMLLYGLIYAVLDTLHYGGPVARSVLFGLLVTRVLADIGMGVSALSISLVTAGGFGLLVYMVAFTSRVLMRLLRLIAKPAGPRVRVAVR